MGGAAGLLGKSPGEDSGHEQPTYAELSRGACVRAVLHLDFRSCATLLFRCKRQHLPPLLLERTPAALR